MNDLFDVSEMYEERAAIREFDGLMTREEAERLGKLDSEAWRHACEIRWILKLPSLDERRAFFAKVESARGKAAADKLKADFQREWIARKGK